MSNIEGLTRSERIDCLLSEANTLKNDLMDLKNMRVDQKIEVDFAISYIKIKIDVMKAIASFM